MSKPGKFEGEPPFVEHFWSLGLEGCADETKFDGEEDDGPAVWVFNVERPDMQKFPELEGYRAVEIWEDDNGFVHHSLVLAFVPEEEF